MAGIFRRRGRGDEPSELDAGEVVPDEVPLPFEPPRRGAALPAGRARPDAEQARAAEVARLGEELKREIQAELAALRRQRIDVEAELAATRRLRAEIEAELAATRGQPKGVGPHLAAVEPPSAYVRRG